MLLAMLLTCLSVTCMITKLKLYEKHGTSVAYPSCLRALSGRFPDCSDRGTNKRTNRSIQEIRATHFQQETSKNPGSEQQKEMAQWFLIGESVFIFKCEEPASLSHAPAHSLCALRRFLPANKLSE